MTLQAPRAALSRRDEGTHVALAALISANRMVEGVGEAGGEALRATLPLAGGILVEHQARLAASIGASPVIILVERLPATLTAAVDRLRRDGLRVEIARGLTDAVDRIHPDESLLLLADGCVPDAATVSRLAEAASPALLTVPDDADHAGFERIDAAARWGGLLLIDGARLRRTAERLGDWDLESTLLRCAVQESAARIDLFQEGRSTVTIIEDHAGLAAIERRIAGVGDEDTQDWPARFLFPPIVEAASLPLVRRGIEPDWIAIAAVALAWLAVPFTLFSWRWMALVLLLASGPVAAIAGRLAQARLIPIRRPGPLLAARAAAATLALLLLAADLPRFGWGAWLLAALVPLMMIALLRERGILLGLRHDVATPLWLASLDGLIWAFLPAAIAGSAIGGIGLLAAYASASFFFVQHQVVRVAGARAV